MTEHKDAKYLKTYNAIPVWHCILTEDTHACIKPQCTGMSQGRWDVEKSNAHVHCSGQIYLKLF